MNARSSIVFCLWAFVGAGSVSAFEDPRLSVTNAASDFIVSWPQAPAWVLEQSPDLQTPVAWTVVSPDLYQSNAALRYLRISLLEGNRYFRLRKIGLPISGLSGYWQLDEGMGQVADDGSGFKATMFFANTAWTAGRIGAAALQFNGGPVGGAGSRAWVSNTNYRVLPPSGRPFSVSLWFSPDTLLPGWEGLLGNDAKGTNGWHVALNNPGPGTNYLVFAATGMVASLAVTGKTLLLPGQWHQLTVTHDGAEGSIYLDSALLVTATGSLLSHDGLIYFGGGFGGYDSFSGRIDDIRTYTNCLTQEEISLTGYWRFDENAGAYAADKSIQGHLATLTDPTAWTPGHDGSAIDLHTNQILIRNDDYSVLPPSGGPFSISFWLRPSTLPIGWSGIMNCGQGTNGWQLAVQVQAPDQTALHFWSTNAGGTLDLFTPLTLTDGVWTKLELTYNGGIATLYVNGRQIDARNGAIRGSRGPLVVGAVPGMANCNGVIDDLKIYSRERGAAEIGPVAETMWETALLGTATNIALRGFGPAGKPLTYSIVPVVTPTNGTVIHSTGSSQVTYMADARKGPDAFTYTVSDGEFTSAPAIVTVSVVQPHWLSPNGGIAGPLDGNSPAKAWLAGVADALDAIWKTNNYFDCFFYAPGEYQSRGWKFYERSTANRGCKHIGSGSEGPDQTTIKLVDIWAAWGEETLFGTLDGATRCDGFEVRQMVLDCNAANVPKYARGEPVWIRIPLATTTRVDTVTLRWDDSTFTGNALWHIGRAVEFSLCARRFATNTYLTNCTTLTGTGQVDVLTVGAEADELVIQLDRRANGVNFYGLAEIEVSGATVSLPSATVPGGSESRLNLQYPIGSAVDGDPGTSWASGPESQVQIALPLAHGTSISQLDLQWNCQTIAGIGRLGPAANYLIRARDENTGQHFDVPYVHHGRTAEGRETATFGTAQTTNAILTDQLVIVLTDRELGVDYYSLREIILANGFGPLAMRLPTALNTLSWGRNYATLRAFDRDPSTQWACGVQGMVGAMNVSGSNLKFTGLKIIGFGTKAGRECFPMYLVYNNRQAEPAHLGNVLIEDCLFTQPATNSSDGVTTVVLVPAPPHTLTNAVIRRCTVRNLKRHFVTSQCFGAIHVEECLVEDCTTAVYFEPDPANVDDIGPVLIRSNRFVNVNSGVWFLTHPGGRFDSITCLGNEIVLSGGGGWGLGACDTCYVGQIGSITNMTALNNIIRYADWAERPTNLDGGLGYADIHHAVMGNNVIALGTASALRVRQYPAGIIIPAGQTADCDHPVVAPPDPPYYPPSLDALRPGYQRAWFNNRNLSGAMLQVRFFNFGVDGPAAQQQWLE